MVSLLDVASGFGTGFQAANQTRLENEAAQRGLDMEARRASLDEKRLESQEAAQAASRVLDYTKTEFSTAVEGIKAIIPNAKANPAAMGEALRAIDKLGQIGENMNQLRRTSNLPALGVADEQARLRALLETQPTPEQEGVAKATEANAQAEATDPTFGPPSVDEQGNLIQRNKVTGDVDVLSQAKDQGLFVRTLDDLVTKGVIDPSQRDPMILAMLNSQLQGDGIFIRTPEGFEFRQGPGANQPGGNKQMDVRFEYQALTQLNKDVSALIGQIERGEINVGAAGTIERMVRTGKGILFDILQVSGGDPITETVKNVVKKFVPDGEIIFEDGTRLSEMEVGGDGLRNISIGEMKPLEIALGVALARTAQPDGRIMKDVMQESLEASRLTGLRDQRLVVERLRGAITQIDRRRKILDEKGDLGFAPTVIGDSPVATEAPTATAPAATEAEIVVEVDEDGNLVRIQR